MAQKIQEVASFDVNTDKAVQSINKYINRLQALEKQRADNIKLGKSTVKVNKEIDATIDQINQSLQQSTTTTKGLVAQQKALRKIQRDITKGSQDRLKVLQQEEQTNRRIGQSIRQQRRSFQDLRFLAVGAAAGIVAGFAGVAEGLDKVNEVLFPSIALTNKLGDATKNAALEYVTEKKNLDALFTAASADNENKQQRLAAVDAIIDQYGPYLNEIDKEQIRLGNVEVAQRKATQALLQSIVAKQKAAVAEQLLGQIIQGTIDKIVAQRQAQEGLTGVANSFVGFLNTVGKNVINFSTLQFDKLGESGANATDILNGFTDININNAIEQLKLLGEVSDEDAASFLEQFGVLTDQLPEVQLELENTAKSTGSVEKEAKDLTGTLAGLQKQLQDAQKVLQEDIQVTDETALKNQQTLINDLKKEIEDLQEFLKGVGAEPIPLKEIDLFQADLDTQFGLDQNTVTEALQKGLDALAITDLKAQIERIEIQGLIDVEAIEDARNAALQVFRGTEQERDELNERFTQQRLQREQATAREVIRLQLQILNAEREIAATAGESITEFDKQIAELQLKLTELDGQDVNVMVDVDTEDAESKIAKVRETIGFVTDGIEQLGGQIIQFFQQQTDAAITKLEGDIQRQQSFLDSLLGNTEDANAQQVQAERDRLDALVTERQKAVERQQALAQVEVAINAAIAIARAAAEGGAGAAITIAATLISLAIGFAQARATAQQAFASGTDFVRRAPGEPSGTDTVNARLDEGEAVIQKDKNKAYHSAVKAIRRGTVDPKLMDDFINNPQKYKDMASASSSGLLSPSLQRQMNAAGVTLNMGGGMSKKDVQALIGEMQKTRQAIGDISVSEWKVSGNDFTKVVTNIQNKKARNNKRFR